MYVETLGCGPEAASVHRTTNLTMPHLTQRRRNLGVNRQQLAQSSGLSLAEVIAFETGRLVATMPDLITMAQALNRREAHSSR